MNVRDHVDQLNAFADADSIKEFLAMMGYKGYRQDEYSCPIANFIRSKAGNSVVVEDTIQVWKEDMAIPDAEFEISTAVREFIRNFDSGFYPELDMEDDNEEFGF